MSRLRRSNRLSWRRLLQLLLIPIFFFVWYKSDVKANALDIRAGNITKSASVFFPIFFNKFHVTKKENPIVAVNWASNLVCAAENRWGFSVWPDWHGDRDGVFVIADRRGPIVRWAGFPFSANGHYRRGAASCIFDGTGQGRHFWPNTAGRCNNIRGCKDDIGSPINCVSTSGLSCGLASFSQGKSHIENTDYSYNYGHERGPQHTLGPIRHLPLGVQILFGALFFTGGSYCAAKAFFEVESENFTFKAIILMFLCGVLSSFLGLVSLIGGLVAI